jgi:hypothetical protein
VDCSYASTSTSTKSAPFRKCSQSVRSGLWCAQPCLLILTKFGELPGVLELLLILADVRTRLPSSTRSAPLGIVCTFRVRSTRSPWWCGDLVPAVLHRASRRARLAHRLLDLSRASQRTNSGLFGQMKRRAPSIIRGRWLVAASLNHFPILPYLSRNDRDARGLTA